MTWIDLGSGLESLRKPCEDSGLVYYSIDIDPKFNPDMLADITTITHTDIKIQPFGVWFSPPCTCFSIASCSTHWTEELPRKPKTQRAKDALNIVTSGLDLIDALAPTYYFMENPRGMLRKLLPEQYIFEYRHTVTYCQYGDIRMKPTDIWTNNPHWTPRPMCKNGDPCHTPAPRGSKTGTQGLSAEEAGRVPYDLLMEILRSC